MDELSHVEESGALARLVAGEVAVSLRLAERLTGIRLTEADLSEPGDRIAVGIHPG